MQLLIHGINIHQNLLKILSPSNYDFHKLNNVIMTPHISAWSSNMILRRSELIKKNIDNLFNKKKLYNQSQILVTSCSLSLKFSPSSFRLSFFSSFFFRWLFVSSSFFHFSVHAFSLHFFLKGFLEHGLHYYLLL